ncbi:hypothetical protein JXB22_10750 [candidate division WOR-3 bacterium]|nr:hypothetical protein [candidate division WOR-3 bacterium]
MIALFISAVILIGALFLYRTSPIFAALRGVAIIILYLIITGFSLPIRKAVKQAPPLVLIDVSKSMAPHVDTINALLSPLKFEHTTLYFSEKIMETLIDSIEPYGTYTDIIGALGSITSINPSAIILVSDGNHNCQNTSLSLLRGYAIPVFAFGIGTEIPQDVTLLDVLYPDYVYSGDSIDIEVMVQSYGYEKGTATVELIFDHSQKKLRRTFQLSNTKAKNTLMFRAALAQTADTGITVTILPLPGETHTLNNTQKFYLTPIDRKIRVVYYTDHVSFNTKFIMQALDQHPRISATYIARSPSGRYIDPRTGSDQLLPRLDTVDALIIDNIACATLPWPHSADAVNAGLGLLCLGTIQQLTPQWQALLPIAITEAVIEGTFPVTVINGFSCLVPNRVYPPFSRVHRVISVHEHAVTVAEANSAPAIAYQRCGQGSVFQISGLDIGTWHFMQKGMHQADVLSGLLPDIIRFIAPEGRNKRLILSSPQRNVTVNEKVELVLKSYDLDFRAAGGGDFWIDVHDRKIPFFESQKGVYHTSFILERSGDLSLTASGMLGNELLTSNTLVLNVSESDLEYVQTLNRVFLSEIARHTGGAFYPIDSLPRFTVPESSPEYRIAYVDLNNPFGYLLVVALFVLDWIVRRRRGMV